MRILIFTSVLGIIGSIAVLIAVIIKAQRQNQDRAETEPNSRSRH